MIACVKTRLLNVLLLATVLAAPSAVLALTPFGIRPAGASADAITMTKRAFVAPFPYLPGEDPHQSVSIGTVTDGWAYNTVPLPLPGRTYGVLPRQFRRGLLYGTGPLIDALVAASEYVDRVYPGSVLWLGNIGQEWGGDIPWSVSHNSGRDADLAFYVTDPSGELAVPPDLLRFGSDGRSREYLGYFRFDDARNWALVKALVSSPHARVQYLFISDPLRARLLAHARSRGEPAAIVQAAARVMTQPGAHIPHDDHLHVRVHCSEFDIAGGCRELGRKRPGVELPRGARARAVRRAIEALGNSDGEVRRSAVRRLELVGETGDLGAVRARLGDESPTVRAAAVHAIATLGHERHASWLVHHWEEERDPFVREQMIAALGQLGGRDAGVFFAQVLSRPVALTVGGKPYDARLAVVDAIRRSGRAEPIHSVVALLQEPDLELRARAADTLRVLTNRDLDGLDWRQQQSAARVASAVAEWRGWLEEWQASPREVWVRDGFVRLGIPATASERVRAEKLAPHCGDERRWARENAQRTLMELTSNRPRSLEWPLEDAKAYWVRWVERNGHRLGRR